MSGGADICTAWRAVTAPLCRYASGAERADHTPGNGLMAPFISVSLMSGPNFPVESEIQHLAELFLYITLRMYDVSGKFCPTGVIHTDPFEGKRGDYVAWATYCISPMRLLSASLTVATSLPPPTSLISCCTCAPAARRDCRLCLMSSTCK